MNDEPTARSKPERNWSSGDSQRQIAEHTILNNKAKALSTTDSSENVERALASMEKQA